MIEVLLAVALILSVMNTLAIVILWSINAQLRQSLDALAGLIESATKGEITREQVLQWMRETILPSEPLPPDTVSRIPPSFERWGVLGAEEEEVRR